MKRSELPKTGPLAGVRAVCVGFNTAGPYATSMLADFGAEVIICESPVVIDQYRTTDTLSLLNKERRNYRSMVLNVVKPEGQEVLFKLIKDADILLENSKAGTWDKRGLTDEVLWKHNPKLVICHVTGFGLSGDPNTYTKGSYDQISQAFSGFMSMNGTPETPMPAPAYLADYIVAILASWGCLVGYINAQKTGKGESIDCAQFEAMLSIQAGFPSDWLNYKKQRVRAGAGSNIFAGSGPYKCKDGDIFIHWSSTPTMKNGLPMLGLEYGSPEYPDKPECYFVPKGTPQGAVVEERLREWCAARTLQEAQDELEAHNVVNSPIITYRQMEDHPHYKARGVFTEWEGLRGKVKGPAPVPRFRNTPAVIWRKPPYMGEDNDDILEDLGYTSEQIKDLYAKEIIKQDPNF